MAMTRDRSGDEEVGTRDLPLFSSLLFSSLLCRWRDGRRLPGRRGFCLAGNLLFWLAPAVSEGQTGPPQVNWTAKVPDGLNLGQSTYHPRMSPDARFFVFSTKANLTAPGANPPPPDFEVEQIYLWDRIDGVMELVSVTNDDPPSEATEACQRPSVSRDGRVVAFDTNASLVPSDTGGKSDVYVRLRWPPPGETRRISVGPGGQGGNGDSWAACVSLEGEGSSNRVAFTSSASNLLGWGGDANGFLSDVFVVGVDPAIDPVQVVSVDNSGQQSYFWTTAWSTGDTRVGRVISSDGTRVVFSGAPCDWDSGPGECGTPSGLVNCLQPMPGNDGSSCLTGQATPVRQVYLRDLDPPGPGPGQTYRVSRGIDDGSYFVAGDADSRRPTLNAEGDWIAFGTWATNLEAIHNDAVEDVFVIPFGGLEVLTSEAARVSVPLTGVSDGGSTAPMLSQGSGWLVFESAATNLIAGDTNGARDVFLADIGDLPAVELERYSVSSTGGESNGASANPDIGSSIGMDFTATPPVGAANGLGVVYESVATNLVTPDAKGTGRDAFSTFSRPFMRGDARGDGIWDPIDDATYLLSFLFAGGTPPPCLDCADMDDDGKLAMIDAFAILDEPNIPPCAMDTSPDALTCAQYDPCDSP